jgi:hypothetical protein
MSITEAFTGSASMGSTEYYLAAASTSETPQTVDGVYQLFLDLSALAKGDVFIIRGYEKVQSAGTQRIYFTDRVANAQGDPHWVSPAFTLMHGWDFSIQKSAGTDRTIAYSIRQVA